MVNFINKFYVDSTTILRSALICPDFIIFKVGRMSKFRDQSESQWEGLFIPKCFQIEGLVSKVKKIATHLRQAFPDDEVQIQVEFQTYQMLQKFQKKLQLEYQIYCPQRRIIQKNDWDTIWRQIHQTSKLKKWPNMEKMKLYKIMFPNSLDCSVFYYHYEKKLKSLETEYNYIIMPHRKTITVHLKNQDDERISQFFVNDIIDMKNKLKLRVETHPQIFTRTRYSKAAVLMLQKAKIKIMILSQYQSSVFYSENYESIYDIKRQVNKLLAHHTSLIKFPDQFVNKYILKEIMRLIYFEINPVLKEIKSDYNMPVEVDIDKAVILITDFHEVFSDGVELVKTSLQKLKILEIECDDLIEMKKILQKSQYSPLVKFNYRYRRCFLLFSDSVTQKHSKIIHKFCQQISTVFKAMYRVIVHFTHLFQGQEKLISQTQRVKAIAAGHNLNNVVHSTSFLYSLFDKVVFEPVELSVYAEDARKKQIEMFLLDFVTNKKVEVKTYSYDIFAGVQLIKSVPDQCNKQTVIIPSVKAAQSDSKENLYHSKDQKNHQRSSATVTNFDSLTNDNSQFLRLSILFEYPQVQEFEENIPIKEGKRNVHFQIMMEKQFKRTLRAWKVILNNSIKLPNIQTYDRIDIIYSEIFEIMSSFYNIKNYSQVLSKKVKDFKEGEKGQVCFVNLEKNKFLPIYKIQFVIQ